MPEPISRIPSTHRKRTGDALDEWADAQASWCTEAPPKTKFAKADPHPTVVELRNGTTRAITLGTAARRLKTALELEITGWSAVVRGGEIFLQRENESG